MERGHWQFYDKRPTLSSIHWLDFVYTRVCRDVIFPHVPAVAQTLNDATSFKNWQGKCIVLRSTLNSVIYWFPEKFLQRLDELFISRNRITIVKYWKVAIVGCFSAAGICLYYCAKQTQLTFSNLPFPTYHFLPTISNLPFPTYHFQPTSLNSSELTRTLHRQKCKFSAPSC